MSARELRTMLCAEEAHQRCREGTMSASLSERIKIGSVRAIAMATFAVFMFPSGTAHAQFRFWPPIHVLARRLRAVQTQAPPPAKKS